MAILEIKILDEFIDLFDDNEKVVQSFSLINIEDITQRNSEYSNTFKIPKTHKNLELLGNLDFLNSTTTLPYERLDCEIYIDGFLFKKGFISIESLQNDISIRFFTGNAGFYEIIKNKNINNIDIVNTPSLQTYWDLSNVISKRSATEGIFFPMVDYNGMPTSSTTVDVRLLLPAFYRKTLMEAICVDAGYKMINEISGDVLESYNNDIIPTASNKLYNDPATILSNTYKGKQSTYNVQNFGLENQLYNKLEFDIVTSLKDVNFSRFVSGNINNYIIPINNQPYYKSNLTSEFELNYDFNFTYKQTNSWENGGVLGNEGASGVPKHKQKITVEIFILVNRVATLIYRFQYEYNRTTALQNNTGIDTFTFTNSKIETIKLNLKQGDVVQFKQKVTNNFYGDQDINFLGGRMTCLLNTSANSNNFIEIKPTENLSFGGIVNPGNCLKDVKQSDFFKDTCIRYCLLPVVNEETKKVYLKEFSNIKNNIVNAVDWSDKLDQTNDPQIEFKLDSYAQNNYLQHNEDKYVNAIPQGSDGIITIANQNLDKEKTLFKSPFAVSETVSRLNGRKVILINCHDGVSLTNITSFKNDVKPRTCYVGRENFTVTYTDGTTNTVVSSDIPLTWFIDTSKTYNAGFQYLLNNSSDLIEILQSLKLVEANIKLNILDIFNLNYLYPIYISEFNSYFIISKINQFDYTSNDSTRVSLIKIN